MAGALNFEDGLKLVHERGNEMSKCVTDIEIQAATIQLQKILLTGMHSKCTI